jgi:hypothetical protein
MCLHPFANYVIQDMIAFAPQSILHKLHRYGVTVPSHRCLLPPSQRPPTASCSRPPHTSACVRACVRGAQARPRGLQAQWRKAELLTQRAGASVRPSVRPHHVANRHQAAPEELTSTLRRLRRLH